MEMFATGEPIEAERALRAGLLNRLVTEDALEAETYALARRIAANAPLSVTSAKQHIQAICAALSLPAATAALLDQGRHAALQSEDYAEGLAAFREKRPPEFSGR